jgi:hypothetical protein
VTLRKPARASGAKRAWGFAEGHLDLDALRLADGDANRAAVQQGVGVGALDALGEEADSLGDAFADLDEGVDAGVPGGDADLISALQVEAGGVGLGELQVLLGLEEPQGRVELGDGTGP